MADNDILTINQAGDLAEIIRGVDVGKRLVYYPMGAKDRDHPFKGVLRAFTYEGGGFYARDADIRDAFVHVSGFMERWFRVRDLMTALSNIDGHLGDDKPIAMIE